MEAVGGYISLLRTIGLVAMTFGAGCAHYNKSLSATDKPTSDHGYFYGRFHIDTERVALGMDGHQAMGLVMRCDDGSNYTIRFSRERLVQVIAARPARCWLVEAVFTDADGIIRGRKYQRGKPLHGFRLAAGAAYYLGDYDAESTFAGGLVNTERGLMIEKDYSWKLKAAEDKYDATTAEMKRAFPHLAGLSTQNRMLFPRGQPPGEAHEHEHEVRSGLAEVVSPERAARLAGFSNLRFATQAQCTDNCPTNGDCVPFRNDDGPAITCIVRCKADQDCPDGLACNCPDGGGSACRPITSTPDDPMTGICLSRGWSATPPPALRLTSPAKPAQ